jgi:hypothetical protein
MQTEPLRHAQMLPALDIIEFAWRARELSLCRFRSRPLISDEVKRCNGVTWFRLPFRRG